MTRMSKKTRIVVGSLLVAAALVLQSGPARAALPADLDAKVQAYKQKLVEWAADPTIVKAVKDANASGGVIPGMSNGKWDELAESDPQITAILNTPAVGVRQGHQQAVRARREGEHGRRQRQERDLQRFGAPAHQGGHEGQALERGRGEARPDHAVIGVIHTAVTAE